MGQVIQKQCVFVTSNEITVKDTNVNTVYVLTMSKTESLFRFKSESYMLFPCNR